MFGKHSFFWTSGSVLLGVLLALTSVPGCTTVQVWLCQEDKDCASASFRCVGGNCVRDNGGEGNVVKDGGGTTEKGNAGCQTGQRRACYSGAKGTSGVGRCRDGEQLCLAGDWGECVDEIIPRTETCNGKDDDCNGKVDDTECGGDCLNGSKRSCYSGPKDSLDKGACKAGTQTCTGQKWGVCVGEVLPTPEKCDKIDNNCNNQVDENEICGCTPGEKRSCYNGAAGTEGKGACKAGSQTCGSDKKWTSCAGQVLPASEKCDQLDNDCDGQIDESVCGCTPGDKKTCYDGPSSTVGKGQCKTGSQTCLSNRTWGGCSGQVLPVSEKCDKLDNDCDGAVDNGGVCGGCTPGEKRACYTGPIGTRGKSPCKDGSQTCSSNRTWGTCSGQVLPGSETCNGKDDDCDGFIDEAFPNQNQPCQTGKPGACASGLVSCVGGKSTCEPLYKPQIEICNGRDDDCDGSIDEGAAQNTYYQDSDGDGYGNPAKPIKACSRPSGYASNNQDCYDANKDVHPRQTGFFSTHRGDGSFDYNCDKAQSKRFTTAGSCHECQSPVITQGFTTIPDCGKVGDWVDACRFDVGKCYPLTVSKKQECR